MRRSTAALALAAALLCGAPPAAQARQAAQVDEARGPAAQVPGAGSPEATAEGVDGGATQVPGSGSSATGARAGEREDATAPGGAAPAAPAPAGDSSAATGLRLRAPLHLLFASDPLKVLLLGGLHLRGVYRADPSPVFDGAYADGGLDLLLSPSTLGVRAHVEWMPIAPVVLKLNHAAIWYTAFPAGVGHGLSFETPDADFSQAVLRARGGEEERLLTQRTVATLVLRARAWRISGQNEAELAGWYVPAGRGVAWYEMAYDLLILRGRYDLTFMDRLVLLFDVWRAKPGWSLAVGAVNEYVRAVGTGHERDRVGGVVHFSPGAALLGARAPSAVLMAGITAIHPNRQGNFWAQVLVSAAWEPWMPAR